jgi:hypothetical protein
MTTLLRLLFFAVLLIAPAISATSIADSVIRLEGRVPPGVGDSLLFANYSRIWRHVAPDRPVNTDPITIIYYSRNDRRRLGVRLPEWGGGGAIGPDTIIIPVDRAPLAAMDLPRVTVHELVHVALERACGRLRLPRWLHEGLAMTLSGEVQFEEQLALSRALFSKRIIPLDSIDNVNRFDQWGATLAYSESHMAVSFVIDQYGIDAVSELLAAIRSEGRFDRALFQEFGLTPAEFEQLVMRYIADHNGVLVLISDSNLFWILAALFVVVAFVLIRIRNRKKWKRMEEEEAREMVEDEDASSEWAAAVIVGRAEYEAEKDAGEPGTADGKAQQIDK